MQALRIAAISLITLLGCGVAVAAAGHGNRGVRLDPAPRRAQTQAGDASSEPEKPTAAQAPARSAPTAPTPAGRTAKADDVVVRAGKVSIRIKRIAIAGSSLSDGDVATLFDTKDARILEERLRKLDASSIAIPEISGDWVDGGKTMHFTQRDVLLKDVHGGRAATGIAASASLTIEDRSDQTRVSTGDTTFEGVDLAQIVHLATHQDAGEILRPLCEQIAIRAISIGDPIRDSRPVTISTIQATKLAARPLGEGFLAADGEGGAASLDDVIHSLAAASIEANDVALAGPAGTSTGSLKSLTLRQVAVRGFAGARISHFELSGLAVEGNDRQPGQIALGSAEIDNVAVSAAPVPSIDRIDLRDLSVDVPSEDTAKAEDGTKAGQRFTLSVAHAGYSAPGLVLGELPAKAALSIEHAAFELPPDNAATPVLLAMGYKHLDLSGEAVSRYDGAARTLDLDRLSLSGAGLCALEVKAGLAGVSDGIVSQDDALQKAAAAAVVVKLLDVTLKNDGLIDKAIGFKAAIDGIPIERERTAIAQSLDDGLAGLDLRGSLKAERIVAALQKFIADPKTLHIALTSKNGLGAASLPLIDSPRALLDAVEVDASAD